MSSKLTPAPGTSGSATQEDDVTPTELLELLGDAYTRKVLRAVVEQPRSGTAVMEAADVSKATAYRRLDALEETGLVASETVFDPDGHHHDRYRAVVEEIELSFESDGLAVDIAVDREKPSPPSPGRTTDD